MSPMIKEARATLVLAVPMIIGQLSQVLMGFTDTVMIGRIGTVPLAASSFGLSIFNVLYIIGVGLLVPVSVFASRSRGAGNHGDAGEYLRHGMLIAIGTGVAELLVVLLISRHLVWFDQPPEVVASVNPFFYLIGLSVVPVFMYSALRQFAESMGRPWVPTAISVASLLLNAGLNWVFIYGHLGSPEFGLTGSAMATLSARILGCLAIFAWLKSDTSMQASWPRQWLAPFSRDRTWKMLHVGMPIAGCLVFEVGAFAAATVMMGWLGAVPLAAHQVAISCAGLSFMVALGLSMSVGIRVSSAVGAGEHARLRTIWLGGVGMSAALSVAVTVVFLFWGRWVSSLFIQDAAVIAVSAHILIVAAVFQLFDGNQVINSAALRGITDVRVPAVMTFVAYWVVSLPLGYFLGIRWGFGAIGIWMGLAFGLGAASLLLGSRFLRMTRVSA